MKDIAPGSELPANLRLKTGIRYGFLTSLINSLVGLALYSMGLMDFSGNSGGWISLLLIGLGIYLATEHFKKFSNGILKQSDVMVIALWLGIVSGIISMVFLLVQLQADPSITEKMQNVLELQLEKQGIEGSDYDKAMEFGKLFMSPGFLCAVTLLSSFLISLFAGFILSFFLKKEPSSPF